MLIDSHIHFWNYDKVRDAWITEEMQVLQKNYLPQILQPVIQRADVDGVIAVQADQSEAETNFLLRLSQNNSFIKGVVGWIDLSSDRVEERLAYYQQFPQIKGWRHIVQAEPDNFMLGDKFQKGISLLQKYNYTYDILSYPHQIKTAIELVRTFPNQKFVLDHCAKPILKEKKIGDWKNQMQTIAENKNVYCKLSGLLTEAKWNQWQPEDFYPYLDIVFEAFGTERILFGSDWPVILLSGEYRQWKNLVEFYLQKFSTSEQQNVMGNNAIKFYNL
ncbi:MAG TPA: amidohydrolase family protein [Ferruginibacter sp.]|nr:amidohydrolase family protein [Ferruginibacter sp.]MBS1909232.1 amidohydrolase family protein [Bacteroidota bacterium]MBS1926081.1 amidohydrolase family protein [Bacteroidota bacterium]HMT96533.1 amidohydrolase family protein [Ferruginibacter sp.]HMU25690.1 amidohydrolase family protein [Ferruginibacter sp.]